MSHVLSEHKWCAPCHFGTLLVAPGSIGALCSWKLGNISVYTLSSVSEGEVLEGQSPADLAICSTFYHLFVFTMVLL